MTHARTQIREAIATLLTGLTTTGTRVFQSRLRPQSDSGLPCLLVTTDGESIVAPNVGNIFQRQMTLVIIGMAKTSNAVDATLDQIALEVETAMAADYRASLQSIETDFDDDTDKPVGRIALTYQVIYATRSGSPGQFT